VLGEGDGPFAPTISQTSDVSKTSDVFPQGERRLFQSHLTEQVTSRHRMSGRHPMSNRNEFRLGNEIGFAIVISHRGEKLFAPTLNRVINNKLTSAYQIGTKLFISISK